MADLLCAAGSAESVSMCVCIVSLCAYIYGSVQVCECKDLSDKHSLISPIMLVLEHVYRQFIAIFRLSPKVNSIAEMCLCVCVYECSSEKASSIFVLD